MFAKFQKSVSKLVVIGLVGGALFSASCEDEKCKADLQAARTQTEADQKQIAAAQAQITELQGKLRELDGLRAQVQTLTKENETLKAAAAPQEQGADAKKDAGKGGKK